MDASNTAGSANRSYFHQLGDEFARTWNHFWFTPRDAFPLSVLRIAAGLAGIGYLVSQSADLTRWLGPSGLLPSQLVQRLIENPDGEAVYRFSPLFYADSSASLWLIHSIAAAIMLAFTVGLFTRLTNVLALLAMLSYIHRVPMLTGPFEAVLTMLLAYLALTASGDYLSVDAWIRRRRSGDASPAPCVSSTIGLHLIQLHTSGFYVLTGLSMLASQAWWNGEAVWTLMASSDSRLIDLTSLAPHIYLINAWTHLSVAFLLLFGLLIWRPLARPLLLAGAALVWLSLAVVSGQVAFAGAMLIASLSFFPFRQPSDTPGSSVCHL